MVMYGIRGRACKSGWSVCDSIRKVPSVRHLGESHGGRSQKVLMQPIPQIVFYQSGIGSQKNLYSEYIQGIEKFLDITIYFISKMWKIIDGFIIEYN